MKEPGPLTLQSPLLIASTTLHVQKKYTREKIQVCFLKFCFLRSRIKKFFANFFFKNKNLTSLILERLQNLSRAKKYCLKFATLVSRLRQTASSQIQGKHLQEIYTRPNRERKKTQEDHSTSSSKTTVRHEHQVT